MATQPHNNYPTSGDASAFANVPEELRTGKRFVVYELPSKVPFIADSTGHACASPTDPTTWRTFEQAAKVATTNGYAGVGILIAPLDDLVGVDLDKCVVDGVIAEWAEAIIAELDSYTEFSPSKTGVHIWIRGDSDGLPDGAPNHRGSVEMYWTERYFTLTGDAVPGVTTQVREHDLGKVNELLFGPTLAPTAPRDASDNPRPAHTDDEVLSVALAAANAEKVQRLLDGDWTGYTSASDGLYGLLGCLIFYTGRDAEQLERIVTEHSSWADTKDGLRKLRISVASIVRNDQGERYSWPTGVIGPVSKPAAKDAPAVDPVTDPAALLDDVAAFIGKYVAATADQLVAITLWAAHTHVFDAFDTSPRLALLSAEKQSGKTRTLEVLNLLSAHAIHSTSVSQAYLFRKIEVSPPTLLFDEVDAIFGKKTADDNEDIRSVLNAGYRRGATVGRIVGQGAKMVPKDFHVYAPAALAAIGELPDTVMDRSVVIRMKRRAPDEPVAPYRQRRVEPCGYALRARLAAWGDQIREGLREADPTMPPGVVDRPADTWEPLLAIADAAGGDWPTRARRACLALIDGEKGDQGSEGVRLLIDIREIFESGGYERMSSIDLAHKLAAREDSDWGELGYNRILDARGLARRLRKYGIKPHQMRDPDAGVRHVKGYAIDDFSEAWDRYTPSETPREAA